MCVLCLLQVKLEAAKKGGAGAAVGGSAKAALEWREKPVGERLTYSLVKGAWHARVMRRLLAPLYVKSLMFCI